MKLKMTADEAIAFADEWSRGMTIHEDSQGWRVVCMVLAGEVRELRAENTEMKERLMLLSISMNAEGQIELQEDKRRLDWLSDPKQNIGNVTLPLECVESNLTSLRSAIDAAMQIGLQPNT